MKKKLWFIVTVVLLIGTCIMGCAQQNSDVESKDKLPEPSDYQFDAKVIEINEDYIMVEVLEGQTVAGEVRVQTGLLSKDEIPELKKGDTVRITHDGKMTMSIPPQMTAVEPIIVIE